MMCGKDWSVLGSQVPHFGYREVNGLMDGCVSQEILSVAAGMKLVSMASTAATRRAVKDWICTHVQVDHAGAGGVICAKPRIYRYTSGPLANDVLPLVPGVARDVGTVLSAKGGTRHYCKASSARAVVPLGVQSLESSDNPILRKGKMLVSASLRKGKTLFKILFKILPQIKYRSHKVK
jgi:hypothetical protein